MHDRGLLLQAPRLLGAAAQPGTRLRRAGPASSPPSRLPRLGDPFSRARAHLTRHQAVLVVNTWEKSLITFDGVLPVFSIYSINFHKKLQNETDSIPLGKTVDYFITA